MHGPSGKLARFFLAGVALTCLAWSAQAHTDGKVNVRVVHFTYQPAGMTAYYRLSLPQLGPAAYVVARSESGRVFYYVDTTALSPRAAALALAAGHTIAVDGKAVTPSVLAAAIHAKGAVPPFSNAIQASVAVSDGPLPPSPGAPALEIDNVLVDAALFYPGVRAAPFTFSSALAPGELSDAPLNTILVSHSGGATTQYSPGSAPGSSIEINPAALLAAWQFIRAGAAHILEGMDHLLLVVCLVAGDLRLRAIAMRITAFSAGHAASIVASFYGMVSAAGWVIPGVELLIALSVFGAALAMIGARNRFGTPALTFLVGLVHGCGLAVGLRSILSDTGPNIVVSLLSFNVGVEIAQLLIGAAVWLLLFLARAGAPAHSARARQLVAVAVAAISLAWVAERTMPAWDAIQAAYA